MRERERGLGQNGESKCLDGRHKGPARTHLAVFVAFEWGVPGRWVAFFFLVTISRRWRRRKKNGERKTAANEP